MIREEFLHFLWKRYAFETKKLLTTNNETIKIINRGIHNFDSGPDFFNSNLKIGGQLWAGNVEIHVKATDWYVHGHQNDPAYNNVILHVVWDDDVEVFSENGTRLPTLVLKNYVENKILKKYLGLFSKKEDFINCENSLDEMPAILKMQWIERMYLSRLEKKTIEITQLLQKSLYDWEAVLYVMLLKNFGLKVNSDAFYSIALSIPFKVFRKLSDNHLVLEALLLGQAGLLEQAEDSFSTVLKKDYDYLALKYELEKAPISSKFSRLRPVNFPTIRLSQFASLYHNNHQLFSQILEAGTPEEFEKIFQVRASSYWNNHYTFGKESPGRVKKISKRFIHLLIINTLLPLKFCYAKYNGNQVHDEIISCIELIPPENNSIVDGFKKLGIKLESAMDSQAVLHSYNHFCKKNACLKCVIGSTLVTN